MNMKCEERGLDPSRFWLWS